MPSKKKLDLGDQEDPAFIPNLGIGLIFQTSKSNIIGADVMFSSTILDLEQNSVVELPSASGGQQEQLAEVRLIDFGKSDSESPFGPQEVPLNFGNEVDIGLLPENFMRTVDNPTPGTSKKTKKKIKLADQHCDNPNLKHRVKTLHHVSGDRTNKKDETVDVLRPRLRRKLRVPKRVPEDEKNDAYYEFRRKNTKTNRKSREKSQRVDKKRVKIIQEQIQRIRELESKAAMLECENNIYKNHLSKLGQNLPEDLQLP